MLSAVDSPGTPTEARAAAGDEQRAEAGPGHRAGAEAARQRGPTNRAQI